MGSSCGGACEGRAGENELNFETPNMPIEEKTQKKACHNLENEFLTTIKGIKYSNILIKVKQQLTNRRGWKNLDNLDMR